MKFNDIAISRENRFSIGVEETSSKYYLSIPVSNQYVDYEEYYELSKDMFESFKADMNSALDFVQQCRERKKDDLLMQKPGRDRGVPL